VRLVSVFATLLSGLVAVTSFAAAPRAAAANAPLPLIFATSTSSLPPAQQTALLDLQTQAINNVLAERGLPASDAPAVLTWGRDTAIAELWGLLVQAIQTPPSGRTSDQANAVAWFQGVVDAQFLLAAKDAGLEYYKYLVPPNVSPSAATAAYQAELATNPSESQLAGFLGGQSAGYCSYQSPAADTADPYTPPGSCLPDGCPPVDGVGCTPPPPDEQQFVEWGGYDAYGPVFSDPHFARVATSVAEALTVEAGAAAGLVAGLAAASISSAVGVSSTVFSALAVGSELSTFADFAATASAAVTATGIGAIVGIIIASLTAAFTEGYEIWRTLQIPQQLATAITNPAPADLASDLTDQTTGGALYGLFIAQTLPEPVLTCGAAVEPVCYSLNPPALPSTQTDNLVTVTPQGSSPLAPSDAFSWYDPQSQTNNTARVNGGWFVVTSTDSSNNVTTFQNLYIDYANWSGIEQRAYRIQPATAGMCSTRSRWEPAARSPGRT
jgi:hypothetical protein